MTPPRAVVGSRQSSQYQSLSCLTLRYIALRLIKAVEVQ